MAQLSYSNSTGSQFVNESNTKLLACAAQVPPPLIFLNYCTFIVLPTESWVTYSCHLGFLECFYQGCLHIILNWSNLITNIEVLIPAETTSTKTMLLKIQLHWEGHIFRMEDHHLPKVALYGELATMTQGTTEEVQ